MNSIPLVAWYVWSSIIIWLLIDRSWIKSMPLLWKTISIPIAIGCIMFLTFMPVYITFMSPSMTDIEGGAIRAYQYAFIASLPPLIVVGLCLYRQFGPRLAKARLHRS